MRSSARPHFDRGLQPERTALAWSRTSVSFLVAAAIMLRWTPHFGAVLVVPLVACSVAAIAIVAGQRRRYSRQSRGVVASCAPASVGGVLAIAVLTVLLGAAALVIVSLR